MNFFQESVYLSEILFQAEMAENAAIRLRENVNNYNRYEIWGTIQLILIASANVSKILWPMGNDYNKKARGEQLRKLLGIDENNLLPVKTFRNYFEHYDERIENWTKNRTGFTDWAMNPSMYSYSLENISRGYDVQSNTLIFQGEKLDLNAVLVALRKIKGKCIK